MRTSENLMNTKRALSTIVCFLLTSWTIAFAGNIGTAVNVTVMPYPSITIDLGQTATLSVFGQSTTGSGIFGWDVSVHVSDPLIVGLLPATVDRTGWTGNPATSSSGTSVANGINAIYDTGESSTSLGVGSPVRLFSVDFTGLALGQTTLQIDPDQTTGADFVTWASAPEVGANYQQGSLLVTIVPEPCTSAVAAQFMALMLLRGFNRSHRRATDERS